MIRSQKLPLNAESVDIVSEQVTDFLNNSKVENDLIIRNRILIEEILLGWMENNISSEFTLNFGTRFKKPFVSLEAFGIPCNVLDKENEDESALLSNLLKSIGRIPVYSYKNGKNIVQLSLTGIKKNKLFQIITAILFAIALGMITKALLPVEICSTFLTDIINPVYSAAFRILGLISGPLIFLSVMWGIYGIGDATTLGLIGKKLILRFFSIIFFIATLSGFSFILFNFNLSEGNASSSSFKTIFEMVLDIIPSNIVDPFINGNTLHLIFCAVIFGIAMLYLGKRVSTVADLVEQINCIVQFLMEFISSLMPYFVFLIIYRLILNDTFSVFGSVWKLFLMFIIAVLILCSSFTLFTAIKNRVSPFIIIKKSISTFLISITTASSAAAFSSNMETCEKKFGIDSSLCAFGIPLGMVMFKTSTTAYYVLVSFFFAKQFNVDVSTGWIATAVFISAMLAIATPPIPGGGIAAYTMLFARLGIPDEALAIVLSMDIIFDFVRTAANMYNLPLALIGASSSMGKLNKEILKK